MKKIFTITNLSLLLLCALTFAGCVKRSLEVNPRLVNGTLEIVVNWPEGVAPAGARLMVYDQSGEYVTEQEIAGAQNMFRCDLSEGQYQVIVHNTDGQNVYFQNTDRHTTSTICAYPDGTPAPGSQLVQPTNIYGIGRHDQGQIATVKGSQTARYTVVAERLTRQVSFYFKITGLETIEQVKGRLIGVSPGILIGSGTTLPVSCFQAYIASPSVVRTPRLRSSATKVEAEPVWYETKMEFFDLMAQKNPSQQGSTQLFVAVSDDKGRTFQITADITATVQDIIVGNDGVLPIEIPLEVDLKINADINNVTVTVEQWDESGSGEGDPRPKSR